LIAEDQVALIWNPSVPVRQLIGSAANQPAAIGCLKGEHGKPLRPEDSRALALHLPIKTHPRRRIYRNDEDGATATAFARGWAQMATMLDNQLYLSIS
jgi:hypothetical protein